MKRYTSAELDTIIEKHLKWMRSSATSRKCRCSAAKVLEIQNEDGTTSDATEAVSGFDSSFVYRVGEIVSVDDYCDDRWRECAAGIHFYITREEAVRHIM